MPGWFAIAAPYLADIVVLARPLFTRSKEGEKVPDIVVQQIAELQNAATQNAETARLLATEMQKTINTLQSGALMLERQLHLVRLFAVGASVVAVIALLVALLALAR
ncbi:MAG: hypothetical protein ABW049_12105 [Spongiibacteraceae bacterium]